MSTKSDLEQRAAEFATLVEENFGFLESEYHMVRQKYRISDRNEPRDVGVSVRYRGEHVEVDVGWGIGNASIAIIVRDNHYPESQRAIAEQLKLPPAKAVNLETAVSVMTDGAQEPVLPEITPNMSFAEMGRRADLCREKLDKSMGHVLKQFAQILRKYGDGIMNGDTSQFPAFNHAYNKKYARGKK